MARPDAELPTDGQGEVAQLLPPLLAKAITINATISSTTEITFDTDTTFLRIYAVDQDIYFKWGTDDVTAGTSDGIVPAGQLLDLYFPVETTAGTFPTAMNFIERNTSATLILHEY